jgi:hypothetical protein
MRTLPTATKSRICAEYGRMQQYDLVDIAIAITPMLSEALTEGWETYASTAAVGFARIGLGMLCR